MSRLLLSSVLAVGLLGSGGITEGAPAQPSSKKAKPSAKRKAAKAVSPAPTLSDVPYGPHSKQVLHFWKAEADKPTPLLFFIHGGGWQAGNRMSGLVNLLPVMLKSGISVVSVEYRFISEGTGRRDQPARQGSSARCGKGAAVRPQQGRRVEPRQAAGGGVGRLSGRLLQSVAGVPRRPGGPEER